MVIMLSTLGQIGEISGISRVIRKFWVYIYQIILILPVLAVLVMDKSLIDGIYVSKEFYLLLSMSVLCWASIAHLASRGTTRYHVGPVEGTLLTFYVIASASILVSPSPTLVVGQRFKILTCLIVFYFIWNAYLQSHSTATPILLWTVVFVALVETVIGTLQNVGVDLVGTSGDFKVTGTYGNPDQFAGFISVAVPLGLCLYHHEKQLVLKRAALISALSIILILPATHIRSACIAVAIGVGFFYTLQNRDSIKWFFSQRKEACWTIAFLLLLIGLSGSYLCYQLSPESVKGRLLIWRISADMIADQPVIGVGYGNFRVEYMNYQAAFFAREAHVERFQMLAGFVGHAHNDYLEILIETGVVGLLCFLGMIGWVILGGWQALGRLSSDSKRSHLLAGSLSSFLVLLVLSLFTFPLKIPSNAVLFFALLAVLSALSLGDKPDRRSGGLLLSHLQWKYLGLMLLGALAIFLASGVLMQYRAHRVWQSAHALALSGEYQAAVQQYNSVYTALAGNGKYHFMLGGTYLSNRQYEQATKELERAQQTYNDPRLCIALGKVAEAKRENGEAEIQYRKASQMMPHWRYPRYLLAKLYHRQGEHEQAREEATRVIEMPVKIPSPAIAEMQVEMQALIREGEESPLR